MEQSLLEIAKELVMAQIEAYRLGPEVMRQALRNTHTSLMMLSRREEVGMDDRGTASTPVDWRKSITRYTVTCLECGAMFKQLSNRHLRGHGLDSRSYRMKYGIPLAQALVARDVTARRRQIALESRMWEKAPNKARGRR
jgi:predicted transcriptional regulator